MYAKVSMIIACYNKASYIVDTLRSIVNQVWDNIEVILVNDGSTDATEAIIQDWVPRLLSRGYEVIVINQENAGVAAAVSAGLERSTGEYVCFPDADDQLNAEYVSILLETLETDPSFDFAVCKMAERSTPGGKPVPVIFTDDITPSTTIEQVLLQRVHSSICVYLVKREYAVHCGMMRMISEKAFSQEPQITTLLFAGGGKHMTVDKVLYIYNIYSSALAGGRTEQKVSEHYRDRLRLYEQTIEQLTLSLKEKARLKGLASIGCRYMVTSILTEWDPVNEVFFRFLTNALLNVKPKVKEITGRIISFGSLGKNAAGLLPLLKGTEWQPNVFWDVSATNESTVYDGAKIVKPNVEQITNGDILLCFPKSPIVFAEVERIASANGAKVLSCNDVIDYLADLYYPIREIYL
ncbi:glycosyltransferase family 2 protein [Paenibacillus glycinis]|uniref:Glycosyltransferase n=1 Tax=Paenibacillus glycinis TaxID=2697035 RepID=A0ABW9XVI7_9BACL|nr:glycosyltransferase family 2 protein [Paenibacillus glycinis]NBD26701.1 glycosyltransferase [Paenibacillus glycinis]